MTSYDIYQDGHYVGTVQTDDVNKAFAEAKDFVSYGEWHTPGTVRVSMSVAGQEEYIRDQVVPKII